MNLSDVAKGIQISEAPQCSNEVGGTLRVWGGYFESVEGYFESVGGTLGV